MAPGMRKTTCEGCGFSKWSKRSWWCTTCWAAVPVGDQQSSQTPETTSWTKKEWKQWYQLKSGGSESDNTDDVAKAATAVMEKFGGNGGFSTAVSSQLLSLKTQMEKEQKEKDKTPPKSKAVRLAEAARTLEAANRTYNHKNHIFQQHLQKEKKLNEEAGEAADQVLAAEEEIAHIQMESSTGCPPKGVL